MAELLLSAEDSSTEPPPPVVGWAAAFAELANDSSELVDVEEGEVPGPAWGSPRSALSYASAEADGSSEEPPSEPGENKMKRAALWAQLVQIAWEKHRATSRELCQQAAALVLRDAWPLDTHRLYVIQQVEAQYALAESYVDELAEVATATARHAADDKTAQAPPAWLALGVDANKVDALKTDDDEEDDEDDDEEDEDEDEDDAPVKKKVVRANDKPFMTKALSRAIMRRSSLRNKFLKYKTPDLDRAYKKQRNYTNKLLKKEKIF